MEAEAQLLKAPDAWNLQPLPCRNCYGFVFLVLAVENLGPHGPALCFAALATLFVNCLTQGTLLFFIANKIMGEASHQEEDPQERMMIGLILSACLFCFFVAMMKNAKDGWMQSALLAFSGGEEWGGQPPNGRRFASLGARKRAAVIVLVVLPELVLWLVQLFVGVRFLAACTSYVDLVMNSVALVFVSDVDEMIYEAMVPMLIKNSWDSCLALDAYHQVNLNMTGGQFTGLSRFQELVFRFELLGLVPVTLLAAMATSYFAEEIAPAVLP